MPPPPRGTAPCMSLPGVYSGAPIRSMSLVSDLDVGRGVCRARIDSGSARVDMPERRVARGSGDQQTGGHVGRAVERAAGVERRAGPESVGMVRRVTGSDNYHPREGAREVARATAAIGLVAVQ